MNPRSAARLLSIGRVAIGAGLIAAPRAFTPMWVGRRGLTPAARLFTRAIGARDLGIGASILAGGPVRPLLVAGLLADGTDLAATVIERDDLPDTAIPLVIATAGLGIALGAYALAGADS